MSDDPRGGFRPSGQSRGPFGACSLSHNSTSAPRGGLAPLAGPPSGLDAEVAGYWVPLPQPATRWEPGRECVPLLVSTVASTQAITRPDRTRALVVAVRPLRGGGRSLPLPAIEHARRGSLSRWGVAPRVAARSGLDGETGRVSRGRAEREDRPSAARSDALVERSEMRPVGPKRLWHGVPRFKPRHAPLTTRCVERHPPACRRFVTVTLSGTRLSRYRSVETRGAYTLSASGVQVDRKVAGC